MENRGFSVSGKYRYGFNGKESDAELSTGEIAFEYRIFDCRIARFFSLDPREKEYPWQSPFAYYRNSPVAMVDIMGMGGPYQEDLDISNFSLASKLTDHVNFNSNNSSEIATANSLKPDASNAIPSTDREVAKIQNGVPVYPSDFCGPLPKGAVRTGVRVNIDLNNCDNVITWGEGSECGDNCRKQLRINGQSITWDWEGIALWNTAANDGTSKAPSNESISKAWSYLFEQVRNNKMVVLGIDYNPRKTSCAQFNENNACVSTNLYGVDHFIVVYEVSLGPVFTAKFIENATSNCKDAVSSGNIINKNFTFTGQVWKKGTVMKVCFVMKND